MTMRVGYDPYGGVSDVACFVSVAIVLVVMRV